ncbi:MAG TPA: hypothetical protein VMY36_00340 [Patescibacteria group bacterium]|nr:hypothetical protein [Patescibacteria group bacterium]
MAENQQIQPTAVSPPVETLPDNPEKKQKPWLVIGLTILLIISLGIIGFLAYQNYSLKNKKDSEKDLAASPSVVTQTPSPMTTETPLSTPTPDLFAGWLIYSNTCYTFKYPNEITLTERKEENLIHLSLWGPTQKQETEFYDGISLTFSFPLDLGNLSLSDYVDSQATEDQQHSEIINPKQAITINGITGYTYINEGLGIFQNIFLQSSDKTCAVEITNATKDPGNQGYQQTVDKILSSFQFFK